MPNRELWLYKNEFQGLDSKVFSALAPGTWLLLSGDAGLAAQCLPMGEEVDEYYVCAT